METRQATPSTNIASDPELSPAEELPGLYRMVLDRVAQLELIGLRHEAGQIRLAATTVYSGAWNDAGRHRLAALIGRADRLSANHDQPHSGWTLRRRSASAR
jgi:hypothetical protein